MSITHVPDEELLVFDHEIAAPVEDVFGAYLDPELLVRWYGPLAGTCAPPTLSWSLSSAACSACP